MNEPLQVYPQGITTPRMNESAAGTDSPIESDEPLKLIETIISSTKVVWDQREIIRVEEFADAIQLDP